MKLTANAIQSSETEEDYRKGDEIFESMSPPAEGMGQRVSVVKYEVAVDLKV